ncbi:MAG: ABC transporter permease [Methanotrichaceae archaeon]
MDLSHIVKKLTYLLGNSLLILIFLALWEILPRARLVDPVFIPPFSEVIIAMAKLTISGVLISYTAISVSRAFSAFAISSLIAIPLGFMVGWFKQFERYVNPTIEMIRQLPVLALFPVFILFFGIGELSKIVMIGVACFQSVFLNVVTGVQNIDPLMIRLGQSLDYSNKDMFTKIVLPAATPSIFTGLRFAATVSIILLVAAEMLGANSGLGYAINNWEVVFQIPEMYAAILMLVILGLISNYVLVGIEKRITHWREEL